jgi:hypothetical protein
MKHKFAGQICIFCNDAPSETTDHALGRKFFLEERRGNLPQVPACRSCNNRKAELEYYLMTVLPFGAKNADAAEILSKLVPPRLEKNAKLRRKLVRGFNRSGGTSIPFDHKPLIELFSMIAKALAFQHFNVWLGEGFSSTAAIFMNQATPEFERMLMMGDRVNGDLGQGTFKYQGSQPGKYPELTLWRFEIYGGVDFGGDPNTPGGRASLTMAATGNTELIGNLFYSTQMLDRTIQKSVGRNDPCPCGSGLKHKKCHGSVAKQEARERMQAQARANQFPPSVYQPVAAHGYGPGQAAEMRRYIQEIFNR